jgi:hypothetical protein
MGRTEIKEIDKEHYQAFNKKGELLGYIFFFPSWRSFVWEQNDNIVMSGDCLQEIVKAINNLNFRGEIL